MLCRNCGDTIPDGSTICPTCGKDPSLFPDINVTEKLPPDLFKSETTPETPPKKIIPTMVLIPAAIVVLVAIILYAINASNASKLEKALTREWLDYEDSIIKVLDITEGKMVYRLETGYKSLDMTLGNYKWKAVGKDKIKVKTYGDDFEIYKVEFNDKGNIVTFWPALTSTDPFEVWMTLY